MSRDHVPALDGVRALAVYLVLLFHAGMQTFAGGYVGVDLFFVLSGFLVSGVVLGELDRTGRLRLGRFYARRVRRLLPAAVVVVVATCATFVVLTSVVRRLSLVGDARSALLYYANWNFLARSEDYFATDVDKSPFLHFWSLAIEEQFYVVFPVLLVGLVYASRRRSWVLGAGLGLLFVLSVGSQLYWMSANPGRAYYGTDARLYQLLAGALLTVAVRAGWSNRRPVAAGAAGLALMLVVASGLLALNTSWRGLLATLASVLLISGLLASRGFVVRLFELRVPVYLGEISYGTYLWHWPVLMVLLELLDVRPWVLAVFAGVLATALAALSAELLELPIRRWVGRPSIQWPVAISGVLVSAIVAVAVVTPMLHSPRKPAVAAQGVGFAGVGADRGERVPGDLDWQAIEADIGRGRRCIDPEDCVMMEKGGPTVLLIGDSHAKMLAPMMRKLAAERGFTLVGNILRGCPWQAGLSNGTRPPDARKLCDELRDKWYDDAIPRIDPDLTILVSQSYDLDPRYEDGGLSRIGGSDETVDELVENTTVETLDRLSELGTRTVVLQDTIRVDGDPLDCLARSTYVAECLVPVPIGVSVTDSILVSESVARDDMFTVDINPVICPDAPLCRPILRGRVVWRNFNHLTTKITLLLRDRIWARFEDSGALDGLGFPTAH